MSAVPFSEQLWTRFYRTAPAKRSPTIRVRAAALPLDLAIWRWLPFRLGVG